MLDHDTLGSPVRVRRSFLRRSVTTVAAIAVASAALVGCSSRQPVCATPPTSVTVSAPDGQTVVLRAGDPSVLAKIRAAVGEDVTVTFVGDCLLGASVTVSTGPSPGAGSSSLPETTVAAGRYEARWTPAEPGVATLTAWWACSGPAPCPVGSWGSVEVTTSHG